MSVLAPLSLAQLGALLALAFGLLAWLHLRTPRPVRTRVPFLGAWDEVVPARSASPARWALARAWGLLRALLLVGAIGLALTNPQPSWLFGAKQTTLILLDAGAHMSATDETPSRFERARVLAADALDRAAGGDELMVAQLDSELTPLSGWSRDPQQLKAALGAAQVSHDATRFSALVEFATGPLRVAGRVGHHVTAIVVSDGAVVPSASELAALQTAGVTLRQRRVGTSARNLAIRTFAVRAYPWDAERCEVMLELENTDAQPHAVELTLFEESRPIDLRPLTLPARSRTRQLIAIGATGKRFMARLALPAGAADAQPVDDEAYAVLAQPPPRRVLLVTAGLRYLESALELDPRLVVEKLAPDAYETANGYDLVVFDRFVPSKPADVPTLWLSPSVSTTARSGSKPGLAAAVAPYRVVGTLERPFFDEATTDAPLLRAVSLRDVNVRRAQRVVLESSDKVLARSTLGPLIVQGQRGGVPFIALTFDVRESDLVLRTGWPILVSQIVRQLTAAAGPALDLPLQVGRDSARAVALTATAGFGAARGVSRAELRAPSGRLTGLEVRDGYARVNPEEPGFYQLRVGDVTQLLAANTDPHAASEIAPHTFAPEPAYELSLTRLWPTRDVLWLSLLALALLVLGIDARLAIRKRGP